MTSFFGGKDKQNEIFSRACSSFIILALVLNIFFSSMEMIKKVYRKIKSYFDKKHESRITNYKISESPDAKKDLDISEMFK